MTHHEPERVTVDGYGVIELFGDADDSALHLDFAPVAYEGWDLCGSMGRFALHLTEPWRPRPGLGDWLTRLELDRVRRWLAAPPRGSNPVEALQPLLGLLAAGDYHVTFAQMPRIDNSGIGYAFIGGYHRPRTTGHGTPRQPVTRVLDITGRTAGWYEWDTDSLLLPTDTWPPRDTGTVERYRTAIRDGHRPALVVLRTGGEDHGTAYVLDGHHKLLAYLEEEILPWTVEIEALAPRPITESPAVKHRPRSGGG